MGQHLSVFTVKKHTIFLQTFIYSIHILYIVRTKCTLCTMYIQYIQCTKYSIYKYSILSGFNLRCYKNYLCASWKLLFFTVWVSTQLEHFSHWAPPPSLPSPLPPSPLKITEIISTPSFHLILHNLSQHIYLQIFHVVLTDFRITLARRRLFMANSFLAFTPSGLYDPTNFGGLLHKNVRSKNNIESPLYSSTKVIQIFVAKDTFSYKSFLSMF